MNLFTQNETFSSWQMTLLYEWNAKSLRHLYDIIHISKWNTLVLEVEYQFKLLMKYLIILFYLIFIVLYTCMPYANPYIQKFCTYAMIMTYRFETTDPCSEITWCSLNYSWENSCIYYDHRLNYEYIWLTITEVKHRRIWSVPRWATISEYQVQ